MTSCNYLQLSTPTHFLLSFQLTKGHNFGKMSLNSMKEKTSEPHVNVSVMALACAMQNIHASDSDSDRVRMMTLIVTKETSNLFHWLLPLSWEQF